MAYFVLHKLHRFPHEFDELPTREKGLVIACIELRLEEEAEQQRKLKTKRR